MLRSFIIGYAFAFPIFLAGSFQDADTLLEALGGVARFWIDWDYNLGLAKPSALLSAFVTGPVIAVLFAGSARVRRCPADEEE